MLVRNLLSEDVILGLIALKRNALEPMILVDSLVNDPAIVIPPEINIKQDVANLKFVILDRVMQLLQPYESFIDIQDYEVDKFDVKRYKIIGDDLTMWIKFKNLDKVKFFKNNNSLVVYERVYVTVHEWIEGFSNPKYIYKLHMHNFGGSNCNALYRELPNMETELIL